MIEIVAMTEDHVTQVAELEKLCFSDPWSERSVASEVHNQLALWLVALDGNRVAGYVGSQTVIDESDMMNIAVHPDYRRQGIARLLVDHLVEELKKAGYGIYLLSNASLRQHEYWPRIEASRFFDGTIISADEGIMKPGCEYFLRALSRFGLKAEECFFVDDVPANVEGAAFCGIPGAVFFGDARLLRSQLRSAGVNVAE